MPSYPSSLRVSIELPLPSDKVFESVNDELTSALSAAGITFNPGPTGQVISEGARVAHVTLWEPGARLRLNWETAPWMPGRVCELDFAFEPTEAGTRLTFEQRGLAELIGSPEEVCGWFTTTIFAPLLQALTPTKFGDWITDRRARRPSGAQARATYRDPLYHYPNFRVLLEELKLRPEDYLLEVGAAAALCSNRRFRAVAAPRQLTTARTWSVSPETKIGRPSKTAD